MKSSSRNKIKIIIFWFPVLIKQRYFVFKYVNKLKLWFFLTLLGLPTVCFNSYQVFFSGGEPGGSLIAG